MELFFFRGVLDFVSYILLCVSRPSCREKKWGDQTKERKRGKKRPSNSTKKNECLSVFINVAVCIKFGICNDGVREGEREERRKKKWLLCEPLGICDMRMRDDISRRRKISARIASFLSIVVVVVVGLIWNTAVDVCFFFSSSPSPSFSWSLPVLSFVRSFVRFPLFLLTLSGALRNEMENLPPMFFQCCCCCCTWTNMNDSHNQSSNWRNCALCNNHLRFRRNNKSWSRD